MKEYKELPFDVNYVVDIELNGIKKEKAAKGYNIKCPFCGRDHKLNVDGAFWRCAACDEKGNAVKLYAKLNGDLDYKSAYKALMNRFYSNGDNTTYKKVESTVNMKPLPIAQRNIVYRALLRQFSLAEVHREDLHRRGLNDKQIEMLGYKSLPECGKNIFAYKAINALLQKEDLRQSQNIEKYGIPGLYDLFKDYTYPKMVNWGKGYVIPVKNIDGLISGFQIRRDELKEDATEEQKKKFRKYLWFSSSEMNSGCSITGCENIHFAGDWDLEALPKDIYLTEGVLKSDIASVLSKNLFLGLTGVNNISQLPDVLKSIQYYRNDLCIHICVDMDYLDKPEVQKALDNIKSMLENLHINYVSHRWPSKYKGIDDYCLALKNGEIIGKGGNKQD